jgi:hypothetical protein
MILFSRAEFAPLWPLFCPYFKPLGAFMRKNHFLVEAGLNDFDEH